MNADPALPGLTGPRGRHRYSRLIVLEWDNLEPMSRQREFDSAAALDAAMRLFWQRGYEGTSMSDLVTEMGVARASIYSTFGSKHDLYLRALERYVSRRDPDLVASLSEPGPVLPALRALIWKFAADAIDQRRPGCFVVNAAIERLPDDRHAAQTVEASWDTLEVALTSAISRARRSGELRQDLEPRPLARFLLVVLQGLRVIGKGGPVESRVQDAARQVIAVLDSYVADGGDGGVNDGGHSD